MKKITLALLLLLFSTLLLPIVQAPAYTRFSELTGDGFSHGWSSPKAIFIRSDGSVEPSHAPMIVVNNTYILTDDVEFSEPSSLADLDAAYFAGIIVEKDDVIIDGNGHMIKGHDYRTGIYLENRRNVVIKNMTIRSFAHGILLFFSSGIKVVGNRFVNNRWGILFWAYAYSNIVMGNVFTGGGLFIRSDCCWNIVENNTLNGKRLVYLEGESDKTVSGEDVGQVILVRCNRITLKDLKISGTNIGIELHETDNSRIERSAISSIQGIGVYNCGIYLFSSSNNSIIGNSLTGNTIGIFLERSSNKNTICRNLVANNARGIQIDDSSNNSIYHNNFIDNLEQALISYSVNNNNNTWDDGSKGNYWSDYRGTDADKDGIGDTPYVINERNRDRYPLINRIDLEAEWGVGKSEIEMARTTIITMLPIMLIVSICGIISLVLLIVIMIVLRRRRQ